MELMYPDLYEIDTDVTFKHNLVIKSAISASQYQWAYIFRCYKHDLHQDKIITYAVYEVQLNCKFVCPHNWYNI